MRAVQCPRGEWENLLDPHAPSVLQIEVGTLAPRPKDRESLPELATAAPTPKLQPPDTTNPIRPAPPGPGTAQGEHRPTGFHFHPVQPYSPGANSFPTADSSSYLLCPCSKERRSAGVCLITQQAGVLQRDISEKRAAANTSNILMSTGIVRVGQSSN